MPTTTQANANSPKRRDYESNDPSFRIAVKRESRNTPGGNKLLPYFGNLFFVATDAWRSLTASFSGNSPGPGYASG